MGLSKEIWNFLVFNTIMSTIFSFTGIFVNLYVWGQGQNLFDVTLFNLVSCVILFLGYLWGTHYLYRKNVRFVMALSCLFAAFSFLSLCAYSPDNRYVCIAVVGIFVGITQGLYWAANNAAIYFFLKSEDYPNYFSMSTVLSQLVTIFIPILSSGLIFWLRFKPSFLVMTAVVVVALWFAVRLPQFVVDQPLFKNIAYKDIFSRPGTRWSFPVMLATGALTQFQSFFSMIFIFDVTNNEFLVALLNVGYSIVLFAALAAYKKLTIRENTWLVIGIGLVLTSYAIALLQHPSLTILIILLMQVGTLFFSASSGRQSYRLLMQDDIIWRTKVGIWYEVALVISRALILSITLLMHDVGDAAFILLACISTLSMFCMPFFQYKSVFEFERVHGEGAGM